MTKHRQLTIRELMLLVVFASVGFGGLLTGGVFASVLICAAIIFTTGHRNCCVRWS